MRLNAAALFTICAGAVLIVSCGSSGKTDAPKGPPPPVPVTVYAVQKGKAVYYDEYPATVVQR